jgi:hypothetical protein
LFEMLMAIPESAGIFEPFHPVLVPEAGRRGLHEGRFVMPGADFEHADFVRRALEGGVRNEFTLGKLRLERAFRPRQFLVKFVRGNTLLPWIAEAFPLPPAALIIRHPGAVVASLLRLGGGWVEAKRPAVPEYLDRDSGVSDWVRSLSTPEEELALFWALENRVALGMTDPNRIRVVSYEHLYRRGVPALEPIFQAWNQPIPDGLDARFNRPSTTTQRRMHAKIEKGEAAVAWREELGAARVERVLSVVRRLGFDAYSHDDLPDEARLTALIGRDRS